MVSPSDDSDRLRGWLDELDRGNPEAFGRLVAHAEGRLRDLARRQLRGFPGVARWEETDDVLQNALLRLRRALTEVRPASARAFFGLAATQIRRELLDLVDRYFGPHGHGARHRSDGPAGAGEGDRPGHEPADESGRPDRLAEWAEFHQAAAALPGEEGEVFRLLWYHELSQAAAAAVLGVSERTVKRRWREARLRLHRALGGGERP
jgi:RNA polymerase sigma-70 factor (ECF subfamily)